MKRIGGGNLASARFFGGLLVTFVMLGGLPGLAWGDRPNIVVILSDDAGYNEFGFTSELNGGTTDFETPRLDTLAESSVVLTNGYACGAVCSPSRSGLLTGLEGSRIGYERNISDTDPFSPFGLSAGQPTLAGHLKSLGYTTGVIGKWNLGYTDGVNRPLDQGFDEFFGFLSGSRYYWSDTRAAKVMYRDNTEVEDVWRTEGDPTKYDPINGRYATDAFGEESVDFINRHAGGDNPFFLYLSLNATHCPDQAKSADLEHFSHIENETQRIKAAQAYAMDRSIGEVLDALAANGVEDDTVVVFYNDNGGPSGRDNSPFSGRKGFAKEGGIRVPFLLRAPGVPAGVSDIPMTALDLTPTFVNLAGGDASQINTDGADLLPMLDGSQTADDRYLHWRYLRKWAVRKGDWKLTRPEAGEGLCLYNLREDPSESVDLSATYPEMTAEFLREFTRWETELEKPRWGILGADDCHEFDHFVFNAGLDTNTSWDEPDAWFEAGTTNTVQMARVDSYANLVLEFGTRDDASYTASDYLVRESGETFMLNQLRFTGKFAGTADRRGGFNGNAVLLVDSLAGEQARIQLDATSAGTSAHFTFNVNNELHLYDDLLITGDGTQEFVLAGQMLDYHEPRNVTKTGTSDVVLTGQFTFGGSLRVDAGELTLRGSAAKVDGPAEVIIGSAGSMTIEDGVLATPLLAKYPGGAFHFSGGTLRADYVVLDLVNDGGTFSPGTGVGEALIGGDYDQSSNSTLEIGIASAAAFDSVAVTSTADLDGWINVILDPDFTLRPSDSFRILTAGTLVDSGIALAAGGDNDLFTLRVDTVTGIVTLFPTVVVTLPGDYNNDGYIGNADYTVWRDAVTAGSTFLVNDPTPGTVDESDYDYWKTHFGETALVNLIGDYNNDGHVDAADYTVWRDAMANGTTSLVNDPTPGVVDEHDYAAWRAHFGETGDTLLLGDYNDDGQVDTADYTAWRDAMTDGSMFLVNDPTPGVVDESDYVYWKTHFGTTIGTNLGTGALTNVPEPGSVALLLLGGIMVSISRRR